MKAYVEANDDENQLDGIEFGYRHTTSPVIAHEAGAAPRWSERDYISGTWPGARAPSFILEDGSVLFDRFGRELTLVDFTGAGEHLVAAAAKRGIPIKHLRIRDGGVREAWERDLVLVRPDHHVAWRAHEAPDAATWESVIQRVCGRACR